MVKTRRTTVGGGLPNKLRKLSAVRYIRPVFPDWARTTVKTTVAIAGTSLTLTNGFIALAVLNGSDFDDPFGDLNVADIGGSVDTDSLFEAQGHDKLNLIYNSYRVYSSTLTFKINMAQLPSGTAAVTFTDTDGTSGDTSGTSVYTENPQSWLVIIPTTKTQTPATSWYAVMHHPLAYKKFIPAARLGGPGKTRTLTVSVPSHHLFIETLYRDDTTDQQQSLAMVTFDAGAGANGQSVFYHMYILGQDSTSDTARFISYTCTMKQSVVLSKATAVDAGAAVTMGTDYIPTETG